MESHARQIFRFAVRGLDPDATDDEVDDVVTRVREVIREQDPEGAAELERGMAARRHRGTRRRLPRRDTVIRAEESRRANDTPHHRGTATCACLPGCCSSQNHAPCTGLPLAGPVQRLSRNFSSIGTTSVRWNQMKDAAAATTIAPAASAARPVSPWLLSGRQIPAKAKTHAPIVDQITNLARRRRATNWSTSSESPAATPRPYPPPPRHPSTRGTTTTAGRPRCSEAGRVKPGTFRTGARRHASR